MSTPKEILAGVREVIESIEDPHQTWGELRLRAAEALANLDRLEVVEGTVHGSDMENVVIDFYPDPVAEGDTPAALLTLKADE